MELHQLRYLVEVARTHSFTRAARLCHVTQPTLSHQIRKLEEEMGEPLLQRNRRGAALTPLGERVYAHAAAILGTVEQARQEAASFSREVQGRLRIGVIPTLAPYFLPDLLRRCRRRFPSLRFQIAEEPTEGLVAALRRGALEFALLSPPLAGDDLRLQHLFEDEFLLALPPAHPLARQGRVALARLKDQPLILMNDAHCLRGQTLSLCQRAGFTPEVFIQSAQLDTMLAMVEEGLGLSLVPAIARRAFRHRRIVFRPLRPGKLARTISLAWSPRQARTRAFTAFLELCQTAKAPPS